MLKKGFVTECELVESVPVKLCRLIEKLTKCESEQYRLPQDEQAVLVHVAEWLHNMRTIEFIEKDRQTEKARETIKRIIPLATRLDNKKLLAELNELAVQYL